MDGLKIEFHTSGVTDLYMLTDVYDYALDTGCLFTLAEKDRIKYADALAKLLRPGAPIKSPRVSPRAGTTAC
jgi:hypothetical protein